MKKITKMILIVLTIALMATMFTACNNHKSTEIVAKAYISAQAEIGKSGKADKMSKLMVNYSDTKIEQKENAAFFEEFVALMNKEEKAELKSYKFVKYETTAIEDEKESGAVTYKYKKDGKGEYLEETEELSFIKKDGKWYLDFGFDFDLDFDW